MIDSAIKIAMQALEAHVVLEMLDAFSVETYHKPPGGCETGIV